MNVNNYKTPEEQKLFEAIARIEELEKEVARNICFQCGVPLTPKPSSETVKEIRAWFPANTRNKSFAVARKCADELEFSLARIATLEKELAEARKGFEKIIEQQPCCEGGGCFYPMFDGEGNSIGEQDVDPLRVIQGMSEAAQESLAAIASRQQGSE